MPQGDSLTVFLGLLFFAGGTAVTAYMGEGAKRRNLYIAAALLVLLALLWWAFPTGVLGTPAQLAQRLMLLVPLLTVVLVAMMMSSVRGKVSERAEPPEPRTGLSPAGQARQDRLNNLMLKVRSTVQDAKNAVAERNHNLASINNRLESLLTTLHRQFGVETPAASPTDRETLQIWIDYLEHVWPFLKDGNYDQAQAKAINFITSRGLQIEPE